jgi:cytochrome c oxidase subunit 1
MLFAVGLVSQFTIGGISGVMHAVVPVDEQHNDSYFVIAHFHYVLFGGSIFALLAAIYYWFPKFTGRMMNEKLGKWNFWTTFVGFNLTFFPMHFLGMEGMPRRYYSYGEGSGWWFWNIIVSFGAYFLGASILLFVYNVAVSLKKGKIAGNNPWDAPSLEWSISSPPPVYNFKDLPEIEHRDPLWVEKYGIEHEVGDEDEIEVTFAGKTYGKAEAPDDTVANQEQRRRAESANPDHGIHMPNPSFYPLIAAIGLFLICFGKIIENPIIHIQALDIPTVSALGGVLLLGAIYGWSFEPAG